MQGRKLMGEGPGARTYNDQGATQGVNVVRPAGSVACCAQAGYGWWRGAKWFQKLGYLQWCLSYGL